jgi:hypothetical protein
VLLTSEVFTEPSGWGSFRFPGSPLLAFCSSPESDDSDAVIVRVRLATTTASLAVSFPYDVFPDMGSHIPPRVYHARGYGAFSAFLTLSRLSSAHDLPALFHAGPVLGVFPSGPFCAHRAFRPLERDALLWFTQLAATLVLIIEHAIPRT